MPPKPIYIRSNIVDLPIGSAASPAGLSGIATITGTMREGQTINFAWPTINSGVPSASAVLEYTILTTTNAGVTYDIYSQGTSPPASALLVTADIGKQFLIRVRVYNAATYVAEVPQIISGLSETVTSIPIIAPTFATGPTISGTAANGQVMTVAFTSSGTAPITSSIQWYINTGLIVGATGTTWTGLGLSGGDQVKAQVQLTGPGGSTGFVDSNSLLVASGTISQAASFGAQTPATTGGWRPQLASGAVESLASYDSLTSGSLGVYTPSIASGRLVFSGASGAPNGAVLRCTGVSGRVYDVTISQVVNRKDIAQTSDVTASPGIAANLGLLLVVRQNAQLAALTNWLSGTSTAQMATAQASPITIKGEGFNGLMGNYIPGEYHYTLIEGWFAWATTFETLVERDAIQLRTGIFYKGSSSRQTRSIRFDRCYGKQTINVDNADPNGPIGDWSTGWPSTGYNKVHGIGFSGNQTDYVQVLDCTFDGGYIPLQISARRSWIISGVRIYRPYFDYRRLLLGDGFEPVKFGIEGITAHWVTDRYSVNEIAATAPHLDVNQLTDGGNYTYDVTADCRFVWQPITSPTIGYQAEFQTYRPSTRIGGIAWDYTAFIQPGRTNYAGLNQYPEFVKLNKMAMIPGPEYSIRLPIGSVNEGNNNRVTLGSVGGGDGGWIGTQRVINSYYRRSPVISDPTKTLADVDTTGTIYYEGFGEIELAANLYHWPFSGFDRVCSAADIKEMSRPVPGSAFEAVTPYNDITVPNDTDFLSNYTISNTLRPLPVLTGLTVTDPVSASFTVTTDYDGNNKLYYAVFASPLTGASDAAKFEQIFHGRNGASAPYALAVASGIGSRLGSSGVISVAGVSTLPPGTYHLYVAQLNGTKKLAIVATSFVVS